ncbi:MAG: SLC13 family permease, partial [bacterium]|nr:SLC13 family permease [bacterium]
MIGPLGCLVLGVSLILVFVLYFRFPAFLALITAALAVAACSDRIPLVESVSLVTANFGTVMGQIGILLAMAAIIGKCMMDSGAADRIVRTLCRLFGEERQHYSLLTSGYILSIPVFFDTVFYLLAPLARAIYARRKRDYALLICATAAGGAITHALVPPAPGP